MSVSERYRNAWETYWRGTSADEGDAIWDADPSLSAAPHLQLLLPHADPALPVVDLGCGNGTQTRYLATRFARAVGVDLSRAAVEHARRADPAKSAEFRQLSLTDTDGVRELHADLGDSNVYMRAVIHQSDPEDRPRVAAAVATLLGTRGRAFVTELTPESKDVLQAAAAGPGGPSPKLRRVLEAGLRPASAEADEVDRLLRGAGLEILRSGLTALPQTDTLPDGSRLELPARWFVLRNGGES